MKKFLLIATFILVPALAFAGGAFQGLPLVGGDGATNCLSFGNNGVCNQFQPAGPNDAPPLSTFPADTNVQGAGNNANPATVNIPLSLTGATVLDAAPLTGVTITLPSGTAKLILNPAGTIAALTVVLPIAAQCLDGQEFFIYSSQTVTALTVTPGSGTTLTPTITTVTAAAPVKLIYSQNALAWQTF